VFLQKFIIRHPFSIKKLSYETFDKETNFYQSYFGDMRVTFPWNAPVNASEAPPNTFSRGKIHLILFKDVASDTQR
jgi:hypothetical protein